MNEVRDLWPSIKVLLLYTLIQDPTHFRHPSVKLFPSFKDIPN